MAEKTEFIIGNEAIVRAALEAGAEMLCGYPITPTTEILHYWAKAQSNPPAGEKNSKLVFLQAEDEMSAGFTTIGGVLAGKKAFTATAGPGNVLMQDAFSMAEIMRIPMVAFINQRGGPSTGTVIYSQQEVNLTCFGGNGEGLRIVYSTAGGQDLYDYVIKAFDTAWRYRFPTFVLADGYQAKMLSRINLHGAGRTIEAYPTLLAEKRLPYHYVNLINTYNMEEDLAEKLDELKSAYDSCRHEIIEYQEHLVDDATIIIFAHGIVSGAARTAVDILRDKGFKIGLFRPITLRPFPKNISRQIAESARTILVCESSMGQFSAIVKENLYGIETPIEEFLKPAQGFTPDEIVYKIMNMMTGKR
jgi:2-oxoglutarate ferredoxin oxidoreductase subunit alpha